MVIEYRTLQAYCALTSIKFAPQRFAHSSRSGLTPLCSQLSLTHSTHIFLSCSVCSPKGARLKASLGHTSSHPAFARITNISGFRFQRSTEATKVNMPILHTATYLSHCYSSSKLFKKSLEQSSRFLCCALALSVLGFHTNKP